MILLLIPVASLNAQVSNVVFIGSINLKGGDLYSYKIQVHDSDGVLTGYSVTDVMGPNETKTLIKGSINGNKKQLKFKETKVVSTKAKTGISLCFISASLKASSKKGTTILQGPFTGYTETGAECATGNMLLVSAVDVMDKLMKTDLKKDTNVTKNMMKVMAPEPVEEKKETVVYQVEDGIPDAKIAKVGVGMTKEITHSSSRAKIQVWDARTVDGDVITILQNDKVILENYRLTGIYKDLTIDLNNSTETLKVIAVTEGTEPLNTARMKVTVGNDVQYIDMSTTIGKPSWLVFKKK